MKLTKLNAAIIIVVLSVTVAAVAWAAYTMTSNVVNVPVVAQATLSLLVNGTTSIQAVRYDNLTLLAICSDGAYTGTITFLDGAQSLGNVQAVGGQATLIFNVTAVKTYQFSARGDHA